MGIYRIPILPMEKPVPQINAVINSNIVPILDFPLIHNTP